MSILKQVDTKTDVKQCDDIKVDEVPTECKKSKKSKKIVKATKFRADFPVKLEKKDRVSKQMKFKTTKENNDCDDDDIEDIEIVF